MIPLWGAVGAETRGAGSAATSAPDPSLPYWAFAWGGGLALAHYLAERPEAVRGRRVLDLASGSGLCAIAALRAGAADARAVDVDPLAIAAIGLNARANRVRVSAIRRDILDDEPPDDLEIVLAGDWAYEERMAGRVHAWLRRAADRGIGVLVGDPGRAYLPADDLVELAAYEVRTTTELEDLERKRAAVYALRRR